MAPPPSNVIAGQLFTLGKMYPQVSSMCGRQAEAPASYVEGYYLSVCNILGPLAASAFAPELKQLPCWQLVTGLPAVVPPTHHVGPVLLTAHQGCTWKPWCLQVQDAKLRDTLQQAALRIYSYMMQHVGAESQEVISTVLEGSRCIWTGAGFAEAQQVVMEAPADMRPLLWQIGELLQPFKELLACLGVSLLGRLCAVWQAECCQRLMDRLSLKVGLLLWLRTPDLVLSDADGKSHSFLAFLLLWQHMLGEAACSCSLACMTGSWLACHEAPECVPPAVQVAPTWQPSHCMRALDRLKQRLGDAVLPEHELQMALQLAEHLGMVKGTVSSPDSTLDEISDHSSSESCFKCLLAG